MRPLPDGYLAAAKRVANLAAQLNRLQASRDCFSVAQLESATDATLARLGFTGWQATLERIPHGLFNLEGWHCAQYLDGAAAAVSTNENSGPGTVAITTGPSRNEELANDALNRRDLLAMTGARCYSLKALQRLVRTAVRATFGPTTPVSFAVRSESANTQMALGRQPRYAAGCATLVSTELFARDGVAVLIWQKGWALTNPSRMLPQSAFRRSLPNKR